MKKQSNPAETIKGHIIDFYISRCNDNLFIGNEVMYGTKRKLVDLLVLHNNRITAIEIKSENDDLRRIEEQIIESKKVFDYVIICTTNSHIKIMMELLPNDIGLLNTSGNCISIVRKPKRQQYPDKAEILSSINSCFLRKYINLKQSHRFDSDEIRKLLLTMSRDKIHNLFFDYLYQKTHTRFNLFMQNRGLNTLIDDIPLLSSSIRIG